MSDLSIELLSTEESYTFPFKDFLLGSKSIRYTSKKKMSCKVSIFNVGFKFKYLISINKQITIISIKIQTPTKFCV